MQPMDCINQEEKSIIKSKINSQKTLLTEDIINIKDENICFLAKFCHSLKKPPAIRTPKGSSPLPPFSGLLRKWWKERDKDSMWVCCGVEGAMTGEKDVLKLVHPGRFIEIHTQPIPAFEVLNRYPRHCITRPDVFRFPWIVVKPESLLLPGKVFFLVPKRTIYYLIKASSHQDRPSSPPPSCLSSSFSPYRSKTSVHCHGDSPTKSLVGMTPKHRSPSPTMFNNWNFRKTTEQEIEEETMFLRDYSRIWSIGVQKRNESRDKEGDGSRSCIRKSDSSRRSLNLRVTFDSDYQRT